MVVVILPVMVLATPYVLVASLFGPESSYVRSLDRRYGEVGRAVLRLLRVTS